MDIPFRHSWELTTREARELQEKLHERLVLRPPPGFDPRIAAGADVSAARRSRVASAGLVLLSIDGLETLERAAVSRPVAFPYIPGYLSFRELPVLMEAWELLRTKPDLLVFDGHGLAHPRRFGLACHGGLIFDTPSIGCAKSILIGEHGPLGNERGATAPLEHKGEVIGSAVRTRAGVKPVYVSPGHLMDLPTATEIVLRLSQYREPETTRRTHRLVNELRLSGASEIAELRSQE